MANDMEANDAGGGFITDTDPVTGSQVWRGAPQESSNPVFSVWSVHIVYAMILTPRVREARAKDHNESELLVFSPENGYWITSPRWLWTDELREAQTVASKCRAVLQGDMPVSVLPEYLQKHAECARIDNACGPLRKLCKSTAEEIEKAERAIARRFEE